jgi:hypothetical protein
MCRDTVTPQASGVTKIVQEIPNGLHQLVLKGAALRHVQGIVVYQPPLQ